MVSEGDGPGVAASLAAPADAAPLVDEPDAEGSAGGAPVPSVVPEEHPATHAAAPRASTKTEPTGRTERMTDRRMQGPHP